MLRRRSAPSFIDQIQLFDEPSYQRNGIDTSCLCAARWLGAKLASNSVTHSVMTSFALIKLIKASSTLSNTAQVRVNIITAPQPINSHNSAPSNATIMNYYYIKFLILFEF